MNIVQRWMAQLGLRSKVLLIPILALAGFGILWGFSQLALNRTARLTAEIENQFLPLVNRTHDLDGLLRTIQVNVRNAIEAYDEDALLDAQTQAEQFLAGVEDIRSRSEILKGTVGEIESAFDAYYSSAIQIGRSLIDGDLDEVPLAELDSMNDNLALAKSLLASLIQEQSVKLQDAISDSRKAQTGFLFRFSLTTGAFILMILFCAFSVVRDVAGRITEATHSTEAIGNSIVSSVSQQSASLNNTAASISQTSATVGEIKKTSQMTAERANAVRDTAETGRAGAEKTLSHLSEVASAILDTKVEVAEIATKMLALNEKNTQIGGIIKTVSDIADQSNLLAVNASIEAAKAGDAGRGFAVVAAEIRTLAGRSRSASDQVASLVDEIQNASSDVVMATEQGVKRSTTGHEQVESFSKQFNEVVTVLEENSDAAQQIALMAAQQMEGIEQITDAIANIDKMSREHVGASQVVEESANHIKLVGSDLRQILTGTKSA